MWWKLVLVTNDFLYCIYDGVSLLYEMQTVGKVDEMPISLYCLSKLENEFIVEELRFGFVGNGKDDGFFNTTFTI